MQISIFEEERTTEQIFSQLIQKIQQLDHQKQMDSIENPEFRRIAQRTIQFKNKKKDALETFNNYILVFWLTWHKLPHSKKGATEDQYSRGVPKYLQLLHMLHRPA